MKKITSDVLFDFFNIVVMCVLLFIWVYPLYFTIIASISEPYDVVNGKVILWPVGLTMEPYSNVMKNQQIWVGYKNSIIYTIGGTLFNLFLTIPAAYALSKKDLPFKMVTTWFFLFTMFFGGGLIPTYLLVKSLGIIDTYYVLMILGGLSIYNMIVTRTFFSTSIPEDLYEAGKIDGASELGMFFKIALPLSLPIIAVMALYYGVGHWNSYFSALIYVSKKSLEPLQLVLRKILILNESALAGAVSEQDSEYMAEMARRQYMAEGMKYSIVFIASAPLLIAYPFVQKYFVKGVMIGSIKG